MKLWYTLDAEKGVALAGARMTLAEAVSDGQEKRPGTAGVPGPKVLMSR